MSTPSLRSELKQTKPFQIVEEEACLNIMRTNSGLNSEFLKLAKSHGITQVQYNILRILRGAGANGLSCVEIANRMITRVPDVTRLIDRLEKSGSVRRIRSISDRRIVQVMIAQKGQQLVDSLDKPTLDLLKKQLGHMTEEELALVNRLMVKARNGPQTMRC